MSRFLRFCAFLSVLFFTGNLMAAGYTCSTTARYTSCKEGYYMSDCGSTAANWTGQTVDATSGNSCIACPDGYTCEGDNVCPVRNGINCAAGTYIKANTTTCTACPAGSYCPGITTDSVTSTSSARGIIQCPAGSYCPAGSSNPKSCPTNYGNSAAGSDADSDCYTDCVAGTVVTVPKTACATPAGAWYSPETHFVYYGSISSVGYCPLGSDSRNGVISLHNDVTDCWVTVPAGYSSAVTTSTARYIRISSETGVFPLAEIQAYNSATQLSLALGSSVTNGANALDGSLTTQANVSTGSGVGAYAIFDLGSAKTITNIRFALGNVTSGYNIVIAISSDKSNWTTVFNQTVYGVSALPGVLQNVPLNTRTNTKCAAGTYHGATTISAAYSVNCTACPAAICNGETNCASGFSTHRNTYPANYHSDDNLKLVKAWFATSSNTGNTSIEECKLSYTYTNNRGTFNQDSVRYQSSTGRYDGVGGTVYYTVLNPGYYGSGKMPDGYCDTDTNTRRHYYQDAVLCPAGKYCSGYTQMPLCSSGTYNDTMGIDGLLSGGYFSTGGAKKATPTSADCVGVVGADIWSSSVSPVKNVCGQLLPGYYSEEGAILPAPGELGAKNTAALGFSIDYLNQGLDSVRAGCLGGSNKCGMVAAGSFSSGAATSSTPFSTDCVSGTCGICPAGTYSAAGATSCTACPALTSGWEYVPLEGGTSYTSCQQYVTPNGCAAGKIAVKAASATAWQPLTNVEPYSWATSDSVLTAKPGYYRTSGTAVTCTICPAGTYSTGGEVSSCTKIKEGYFSSGAATSSTPSSADCVSGTCGICEKGTYSAAGATSCSSCPALGGSNWTWDMLKGAKTYSECKRKGVPDGCSAGTVTDTATSATTWGNRVLNEWAAPGNTQIFAQRGYQIDVTNLKCTICPNGHYSPGNTSSCEPVDAGYYATGAATTPAPSSSEDCVTGTCGKVQKNCYGASGATSACPNKCSDLADGTYPYSDEGADSPNKCFTSGSLMGGGYIATAGGPRRDCPLGTYKDFHVVYYGQTSRCTVCPSGTTTTTQSAHNISSASCSAECMDGDGVYEWQTPELSSDGGTVLKLCQAASCKAGNALGTTGQCNECPAGHYQPVDGYSDSTCAATPDGYYNNEPGATEPLPCPAGQWSVAQSKSCAILPAGYWNNGCGTDNKGSVREGYLGGEIAAGYWGEDGATTATGSGMVDAGYWNNGGGTSATPTASGNGCVLGKECGTIDAGYWSGGGAKTATPASTSDCVGGNCGLIHIGFYSTGGGKTPRPYPDFNQGDACLEGFECGYVAAGYYSNGGGTSATPKQFLEGCVGQWNNNGTMTNHICGKVNAGYYSTGGAITPTPTASDCHGYDITDETDIKANRCGMVNAGYWNDGCGINATGGVCNTTNKGGQVNAGYYNLGGGTSATPVKRGNGCANVSTTQCGTVAPGYWGAAGATQYGGSGAVAPGYYSTGGATSRTPSASDCVGKVAIIENGELVNASNVNNTCGQVQAGYWNNACGINATGGVCSTSYQGGIIAAGYWGTAGATDSVGSGRIAPGYYSTGGATIEYPDPNQCVGNNTCGAIDAGYWNNGGGTLAAPTAPGNGCHSDKSCGQVNAGYYSTGGGTSATPTAASNGCLANKFCGRVNAGYYSTGGGTSATPTAAGNGCLSGKQCGKVNAGYYATGGATSAQGHGIIKLGLYSTCGATSEGGSNLAASDYLECADGCECGRVAAGYFANGGGTSATPTAAGNGCLSGQSCGTMAAGYYSRGGAGSANASGHYCWGYNEYSDGVNGCGQVGAGYWNNGGGTDVNGTCVSGKSCGLISAGYYGNAGATTSTGAGEVNGGFFSTGGGKTATPASNSDCAGDGTTCGKIAAGYWSYRGGKTATPTSSADCTMGYCGVIRGGYYSTCGGIEEYATEGSVNSCADGCECGPINPGYYSTGCSISDDGAVCDTSKYTVGEIVAGYYSDGGSNTPQGDGLLAAGYFSTGGATVRKPTSADCVGSNTCGTVNAGYYVSGGGTLAAPVAFGNGCVGQWKNNAGEMVNHACGKVGAGYWNNGGGTDVDGTCVSGKSCGLISAGYYGNAGATSSTGAGTVWPGHFSTGGATKQKPTAADCVGDNTCGLVAAGYWTSHGGKTATPTTPETDCVNKACGKVAAGYFSTGGATRSNPTEVGNHCFGTSCGLLGAGYYSSGGGTSATPTAVGNGCLTGFVCGACPTGYDDNTDQGKSAVNQCQISCAAGTRVAARNAACTSPAGGWFSAATLTSYGNVSPVSYCMDGYTSTSTSASGHDAATDCVQTIAAGKYVPSSKINARYVKLTGNLKNSVNNYGVHVVEMQAFASSDGTGTNLMADSTSDKTTDDDWTTSSHVSISTSKTWDLGSVQSLGSLKFALYPGRTYYDVAIYVSEDNTNWTTVFGPQDVLTQSVSPLVGEVVVLSAVPKSCALGTYKVSGSLALTNTSSCDAAQAGYFVGTTGASSQTKCVMGSYTDTTGQSACKACAGGKTNSADGATSCTATCSNATGVASTGWETPVWGTDNKMTNLCTVKATAGCSANYYKNSNACSTCASGTNSKYTLSAAGTTTVNNCYLNTTAKNFVKTPGAGQTTCEKGNYCPGSVKVYYGGTASDTHPTTGGSTQCPANSYCVAGVSEPAACSTLGGGLYKNSDAGSDAAEDCNFTTTGGTYLSEDGVVTDCEAKYYCPATQLNYPSTGGRYDCPDPTVSANVDAIADVAWLSAACPDATTSNSSIVSTNWQSWGNTKLSAKSQCPALINIDTPCTTFQIQDVKFNTTTGKYDADTAGIVRIASTVKAGYYFTEPYKANYCTNSPTMLMYYKTAAKCTANSYCPGATVPRCDSGEHTYGEPFGIYACKSLGDFYTTSAAGAKANTACYGITSKSKHVANANDKTETTCAENGYCDGNATVYYGSTGGRTACVAPYGFAAAGSDDANDCYLKTTAGQYVETAGAGQTVCPAGYWCVGNVVIYKGGSVTGRSTEGGSEQCPAGYRDGTTGYSLQSQCTMNVLGGKYVAVAKESSASGTCEQGYAKEAHPVTYGETSTCDPCKGATYAAQEGMDKCEPCPTVSGASGYGYWNTSSEAGNHKVRAGCQASFKNASIDDGNLTMYSCYVDASADTYGVKGDGKGCWVNRSHLTCNGGYYNKKFNDSTSATQDLTYKTSSDLLENVCRDVESGYWSGADSLTRTACETGLVTCGAGLCANEAGDCGRKLHAGDNVIYLRSQKRTGVSPLLHLKVGDKMFYGNMSTSLSSPLKVKYNNTKYSVVNDNQ